MAKKTVRVAREETARLTDEETYRLATEVAVQVARMRQRVSLRKRHIVGPRRKQSD